jgi:hypothetical protein
MPNAGAADRARTPWSSQEKTQQNRQKKSGATTPRREKVRFGMADRQTKSIEVLEQQHQVLKTQLGAILRHAHLTPIEEQAARELKKKKLDAKDRIVALRRSVSDQLRVSAAPAE